LGGETAEMPGFYPAGEYDLAGFCVGLVERERLLDGHLVGPGDKILGLASSGLHSNGFSLVRKIVETAQVDLHSPFPGQKMTVGEVLLTPTRIYVKSVLAFLRSDLPLHGLAHITGGGLLENVPRILRPGLCAQIERGSWQAPPVFGWLQELGQLEQRVLDETFNQGLGMVAIVPAATAAASVAFFEEQGVPGAVIGTVVPGETGVKLV